MQARRWPVKWILGIAIGWIALGLVVCRWVGIASGPKVPEEHEQPWLDDKPDRSDRDPIETADLVEAALEDFYGDPFPGAGPRSERGTVGRQGRLSPTSRRVG